MAVKPIQKAKGGGGAGYARHITTGPPGFLEGTACFGVKIFLNYLVSFHRCRQDLQTEKSKENRKKLLPFSCQLG